MIDYLGPTGKGVALLARYVVEGELGRVFRNTPKKLPRSISLMTKFHFTALLLTWFHLVSPHFMLGETNPREKKEKEKR